MRSARTEPSVCAVCVTADRPEMAARAVRGFLKQTYPRLRLLVVDTGKPPEVYPNYPPHVLYRSEPEMEGKSVGELRNLANGLATIAASPADIEIFVHFDDDDYSHPNRIAEQVAFLQASGLDAVGYREMLFWDNTCKGPDRSIFGDRGLPKRIGEAWLYTNTDPVYCLGTSLCYWRRVWEERPFPDKTTGEDFFWLQGVHGQPRLKSRGVSAHDDVTSVTIHDGENPPDHRAIYQPRMIATIHGGNIASRIQPGTMEWKRVPAFDDVVRKTLDAA